MIRFRINLKTVSVNLDPASLWDRSNKMSAIGECIYPSRQHCMFTYCRRMRYGEFQYHCAAAAKGCSCLQAQKSTGRAH